VIVVACAQIRRWSTWLLLGVICGFGALTKATFFPFLAAIALLLLYRTWRREASSWQFLAFLSTVIALAGWWYFQTSIETGMLFATPEGLALREKGGLIAGLMQHFSVKAAASVIAAQVKSFLWGGTWARVFVTLPRAAWAPLVAMSLLIGCSYLRGLHSYRMYPLVQLTPLALGLWALALIYPILIYMGLGIFDYPGYYLHSFAPALAPVIGIAITTLTRNWLARTVVWLLLGYNIVFLFGATFIQFLYFAGCDVQFNVASASACLNEWQRLTDNLDALAYPLPALWLAAVGAIALAWGMVSLALANSQSRSSRAIEHRASAS
jgi:hypothetical protein